MYEMFVCEKVCGSFLDEKRIKVSNENDIRKSLLVTGFPYNTSKSPQSELSIFSKVLSVDIPVRRIGSAALDLCWTACGRFDGFWEFNLNPWDVAAGTLIVTEAGGNITGLGGELYSIYGKQIVATNGLIHQDFINLANE